MRSGVEGPQVFNKKGDVSFRVLFLIHFNTPDPDLRSI
jgi:hypothetical protein